MAVSITKKIGSGATTDYYIYYSLLCIDPWTRDQLWVVCQSQSVVSKTLSETRRLAATSGAADVEGLEKLWGE